MTTEQKNSVFDTNLAIIEELEKTLGRYIRHENSSEQVALSTCKAIGAYCTKFEGSKFLTSNTLLIPIEHIAFNEKDPDQVDFKIEPFTGFVTVQENNVSIKYPSTNTQFEIFQTKAGSYRDLLLKYNLTTDKPFRFVGLFLITDTKDYEKKDLVITAFSEPEYNLSKN